MPSDSHPVPDNGSPEVGALEPSRSGWLKALLRRWVVAIPLGILLGAAVALAVWFSLPPGEYVAYITLHMPMHPRPKFLKHPEDGVDFGEFKRTQFALLRSHSVLEVALRDPKVQRLKLPTTKALSPAEWLANEIRVESPNGPELPRVTLSGDDPEQLKVLVTAIVDAYMSEVVDKLTRSLRQQRMDNLKATQRMYEERMKRIRDKNEELIKAAGGNDGLVELKRELSHKQLAAAKSKLVEVRMELHKMQVDEKIAEARVKSGLGVTISDKDADAFIDRELAKDLQEQAKLEVELAKARATGADDDKDPGVRSIRDKLNAKTAFIEQQRKALRPKVKEDLQKKVLKDTQADLDLLKDKIRYYKQFEEALETEVRTLQTQDKKLHPDALNLEDSKLELVITRIGCEKVAKEIDSLAVEMDAPPRVRKLEDAVVLTPDDGLYRLKVASLASLGAFVVVLIFAPFMTKSR